MSIKNNKIVKISRKEKNDALKNQLKSLKKLGILKDVNRGKSANVTGKDRKKVEKAWSEFHEIGNAPWDYKKVNISKLADWQVKQLKKSGYKTVDDKYAFVQLQQGAKDAVIKREKIKLKNGFFESRIVVERKYQDIKNGKIRKKREKEYILPQSEFLDTQEQLIKDYDSIKKQARKNKEIAIISVKVFDRGTWTSIRTDSIENLLRYVNDMQWHDKKENVDYLKENLHLVVTYISDIQDLDAGEKTQAIINSDRYYRKKNSAKTKTNILAGEVKKK